MAEPEAPVVQAMQEPEATVAPEEILETAVRLVS
jgi:hypothetical protein